MFGRWRREREGDLDAALLARCKGFTVHVPGGLVGTVEEVVWGESRRWDRPEGITVRTGPEGKKLVVLPADAVEEVLVLEQRIVVRQSALG